jgi:hypothetical protein
VKSTSWHAKSYRNIKNKSSSKGKGNGKSTSTSTSKSKSVRNEVKEKGALSAFAFANVATPQW